MSEIRETLMFAAERAIEFLEGLDRQPVGAVAGADEMRARFGQRLPAEGVDARTAVERLVAAVDGGLLGMPSGRFFAWVIGGALPSALAADWLTSAWGQNAVMFASSPAASIVEDVAGAWLKDLLRLPSDASFAFVTGCQMAHVTCLAAARNALLRARGWDVETRGLSGAPQITIVSSDRRHASLEKAARLLGFGTDSLRYIEPNDREVLAPEALDAALRRLDGPAIVALQAGDINTGAFDDFRAVIPVAKKYGAWVHVDGAFGLWAAASPRHRHLVDGIELADSWATDGHKYLSVPFDCGYAFVRDAAAHRAAMSVSAPYIAADASRRDEIDWNPEWSRRARGFATYAALVELGRAGVADLVVRTCRYANEIVTALGALPETEVLWQPILNQGLVRFVDDRRTEATIERVVASGEAFFAPTTWRGMRAMRVSVLNWRTTQADVRRAVAAVAAALEREAVEVRA
ncbi:MAG: aspartate aminotransferase family protein [Candidatus Eremiobacteraeota bacterium]|nr:aspartate aminotransferase family protein [Candidatus Eremiobacteraeota bacterium]